LGALWTPFQEERKKEERNPRKEIFETGLGMAEVESYRQRRFFLLPSLLRALI
jgi:hypothetical protein